MHFKMTFWEKSCKRCGKKIDKKFSYCPHCGSNLVDKEKEQKDYGFLGKDDDFPSFMNESKLPFGLNFIFKSLIKEMDKQFKELDKQVGMKKEETERAKINTKEENPFLKQGGVSINISSGQGTPVIRVKSFGNIPEFKEIEQEIKSEKTRKPRIEKISDEKAKKLASLPRQEAESKVRRLSGKIIYEIEIPGVKNLKDIFVNQLENSIEIKAFSKDKAYFKFLPVALPLLRYGLKKEKLILELGTRQN